MTPKIDHQLFSDDIDLGSYRDPNIVLYHYIAVARKIERLTSANADRYRSEMPK